MLGSIKCPDKCYGIWINIRVYDIILIYTLRFILMRTNIVIEDKLMKKAMHAGHYKTKKETITAALELLVHYHNQTKVKAYRGKLKWEGDLNKMREDK